MVYLTIYMYVISHYSPLNSQIADSVVDINVKCIHSTIAGNVVSCPGAKMSLIERFACIYDMIPVLLITTHNVSNEHMISNSFSWHTPCMLLFVILVINLKYIALNHGYAWTRGI